MDKIAGRIICQFSCGAASAVATKLMIAKYGETRDVQILNAFILEEHEDNRRFLLDCEKWFGREITVLKNEKYNGSALDVFRQKQFMKSRFGAPCSMELKRKMLGKWQELDDVIVLGFTAEEENRYEDFVDRYPEREVMAPLIDAGLDKQDCKAMVLRAGIKLPHMYELGYDNANCIGCVKGGEGYFRAIKIDFPEHFEKLCALQESIGPSAYLFRDRKTQDRYSLREMPPGRVRRNEVLPTCSFFCEMAESDYSS